jgi:hypothetical protein
MVSLLIVVVVVVAASAEEGTAAGFENSGAFFFSIKASVLLSGHFRFCGRGDGVTTVVFVVPVLTTGEERTADGVIEGRGDILLVLGGVEVVVVTIVFFAAAALAATEALVIRFIAGTTLLLCYCDFK